MVLIPREALRWYGFDPSGDAWCDSGNSGDVRGCVTKFIKRLCGLDNSGDVGVIWVPREMQCAGGLPRET